MMQFFRFRLRFFRVQTVDLYRRYNAIALFSLLLFGQIVIENPTLIAQPILVFSDHPRDFYKTFFPILIWFIFVIIWAQTHKEYIRGGSLTSFMKSLAIPAWSLRMIDFFTLLYGFLLFVIPFGMSIFVLIRSDTPFGSDGYFWFYFIIILSLTISIGKASVYGGNYHSYILHCISLIILFFAPVVHNEFFKIILLILPPLPLFLDIFTNSFIAESHIKNQGFGAPDFSKNPNFLLLEINYNRFLRIYWKDIIPRIMWAVLPLSFAWWLIHDVGNSRDAKLFLHLSIGIFIGIYSGSFRVLLDGRSKLTTYAKSTSHGVLIFSILDKVSVISLGGFILFSFLIFSYKTIDLFQFKFILSVFFYYIVLLGLLGISWLQLHKRVVEIKFAVCVLALLIGGNIL